MGDKETEAPQQDKDVTVVQTQDTLPATNQDNCSEDTNAAPDNKGDSQQEEPSSDGASVPSIKESEDKPAVSAEETAITTDQDDEGTSELANESQERLPQEAPAAAEQNVSEKDVETIGPPPQVEPIPISDAPPRVKDVDIPDGAPAPFNEESGDKSADGTEETTKTTYQDANQEPAAPAAENVASKKDVETIGPTPQVESTTPNSDVQSSVEDNGRKVWIWIPAALVVVAFLFAVCLPQRDKDPSQNTDLRQIDKFHREMENLKVKFPSQREELWKRSKIHLQRHFHISQPTEPVSIILTAGVRAEGTLYCLAQSIASALSSALNVSALDLDGASKSSQDSDKVKSDIDSQLQSAFEGGKPIAVIHRFEELPPASTLIFYRYCDHENAAFKKTFLIFTVLLGEEEEIQAKIRLSEVEEMVTDHLQKKFLSHGHPSAFDKMDIDKYGGLWSRISHLILPVATEKRIEKTKQC